MIYFQLNFHSWFRILLRFIVKSAINKVMIDLDNALLVNRQQIVISANDSNGNATNPVFSGVLILIFKKSKFMSKMVVYAGNWYVKQLSKNRSTSHHILKLDTRFAILANM